MAPDGERLYVGLKDEIVIFDTETGQELGILDPEDVGIIDQLGQTTGSLDEERTDIERAC